MFTELIKVIKERPVFIQTAFRDGKVHLLIAPKKLKEDENAAYWTPFSVSGTPEELDANLAQKLTDYVTIRQEITTSLEEALKTSAEQMKKAAEEAKKKAAERTAKKPMAAVSKPTATVAVTPTLSDPSGENDDLEEGEDMAPPPIAKAAAVVAVEAPQVSLF